MKKCTMVIVSKRNGDKVILNREVVQSMIDKGETLRSIARHFNIRESTLNYNISKLEIDYNKNNCISNYIRPEEVQKSLNRNMTVDEIAAYFNCSTWPIRKIINEYKLTYPNIQSKQITQETVANMYQVLGNKYKISNSIIKKVIETELDILGTSGIMKKYNLYK